MYYIQCLDDLYVFRKVPTWLAEIISKSSCVKSRTGPLAAS